MIFIHGFLSSSSLWKETVFLNLSKRSSQNYRLFAVDLLGFGRSPKPGDCTYTLRNHVEMIERSVIVPFELNSFHLVAHSMGCVIALALAAKHPASVKSITLVAPVSVHLFPCIDLESHLSYPKPLIFTFLSFSLTSLLREVMLQRKPSDGSLQGGCGHRCCFSRPSCRGTSTWADACVSSCAGITDFGSGF